MEKVGRLLGNDQKILLTNIPSFNVQLATPKKIPCDDFIECLNRSSYLYQSNNLVVPLISPAIKS